MRWTHRPTPTSEGIHLAGEVGLGRGEDGTLNLGSTWITQNAYYEIGFTCTRPRKQATLSLSLFPFKFLTSLQTVTKPGTHVALLEATLTSTSSVPIIIDNNMADSPTCEVEETCNLWSWKYVRGYSKNTQLSRRCVRKLSLAYDFMAGGRKV
jgi:hypothetical protein